MTRDDNASRRECRSMEVRELRADTVGDADSTTITGYAAVFNEETDLGYFREVVKPGAFKRAIKDGQDVRALWNHDPNYILGRTKSGTLKLEEDKRGLRIEITPPRTNFADDLIESIRRGDVDQMSFAFTAVEETWTERKDEPALRELIDVNLYDISPVTYPAYDTTSVGVRSAEAVYEDHIKSLEGLESDGDDDDERPGLESDRARAIVDVIRQRNKEKK